MMTATSRCSKHGLGRGGSGIGLGVPTECTGASEVVGITNPEWSNIVGN